DYVNTAYPEGLIRILEATPERYAVIDAGTNSIKFHLAELSADGWRTIVDRAEVTRLGEGLTEGGPIAREPGERASRLAYLAARAGLPAPRGITAVLDTGGGSTQLTFGRGEEVEEQWSVNVGAARYTDGFGLDDAVSADVLAEARAQMSADLARLDGTGPVDELVGMG